MNRDAVREAAAAAVTPLHRDDDPVRRLYTYGPESLTDAELLSIVLGNGGKVSSLELARHLLGLGGQHAVAEDSTAGLRYLDEAPIEEVINEGASRTRAARVKAVFEIVHRLQRRPSDRPIIRGPGDAAGLLMTRLRHLAHEEFHILHLNTKNHVLATHRVSVGTLDSASAHPREIFRSALKRGCASIIAVHNHPSGDPTPSPEDIAATRRLVEAGATVGVDVLDHVIVGHNRYLSLRERGLL